MTIRKTVTPSLVLAVIAVAVYINTLPAQFTFDDNFAVTSNGDVTDPEKPVSEIFKNDFWGQTLSSPSSHKSYRPFTILSFRFQRIVGQALFEESRARYIEQLETEGKHDNSRGLDPTLFHLSNVMVHAAATVTLYRLALRLIAARHQHFSTMLQPSTQDMSEAFVAALIFAVHPVHTEAVAGIVGHAELLCAVLSMMGLMSYMAAADGRVSNLASHWGHVVMAVLLGWAAALTKEIGITIMGSMACYELLIAPLRTVFGVPTVKAQKQQVSSAGTEHVLDEHRESPSKSATKARKTAAKKSPQQHGLGLKLLRLLVTAAGVLVYVKGRSYLAGDQLVRIYRKVENPIAFSNSSLERKLTTGYLHSRYFGLLLAPIQLSADWSFACIDYVSDLRNPRNLATLALYLFVVSTVLIARPWRVLAQWAGVLQVKTSAQEQTRRWRLAVLMGLVVAPFFPASNVLFYVGTFIGERLLYFPSVGFCLLVAELLAPPLLPLSQAFRDRGLKGVFGKKAQRLGGKTVAVALLLAVVVGLFTLKTVHRNSEWHDEETLFIAAQDVCGRSAKVQLNSGIIERRYKRWDAAIKRFRLAQEIDETYCEPDYHLGATMVQAGLMKDGIDYLEKGIACKYTASDAVTALNQVFAALSNQQGIDHGVIGNRWSQILVRPELRRYNEAMYNCEQAALAYAKRGNVALVNSQLTSCQELMEDAVPDAEGSTGDLPMRAAVTAEQLDYLKKCLLGRKPILLAVAGSEGNEQERQRATAVKLATYTYFTKLALECRGPPPRFNSRDDQQPSASIHLELLHGLQAAEPEDPWIQLQWAESMFMMKRYKECVMHGEVAGRMLNLDLSRLQKGDEARVLGLSGQPLKASDILAGAQQAYQLALQAVLMPGVGLQLQDRGAGLIRVNCVLQADLCALYKSVIEDSPQGAGLNERELADAKDQLIACNKRLEDMKCEEKYSNRSKGANASAAKNKQDRQDAKDEL